MGDTVKELPRFFSTEDVRKILKIGNNVNGKIICRKMAKKNVVFPTYFLYHKFMI